MSDSDSNSDEEVRALADAYTARDAVQTTKGDFENEHVSDYDVMRLSTMMLCFTSTGTVLSHKILWLEQLLIMLIFASMATATHQLGLHSATASAGASGLADKMATLGAFLLGFYTSLTVSRWWRLRTDGVGNIWSSCSQLQMFISQFVTKDEQVLTSIRRYARASLTMIFMKRHYGAAKFPKKLKELVDNNILTVEEVEKLKGWNNNLAESIWTWVAHIVASQHKAGNIKSEQMLTYLMEKVNLGRSGAALIGAQMGTPIPLPYVHLMGFLVKVNNVVTAVSFGYLLGDGWRKDDAEVQGGLLICTFKCFFIPLLYNSLLLINAQLSDPFGGDLNDFPLVKYEMGIETDGASYVEAGLNLPNWMSQMV